MSWSAAELEISIPGNAPPVAVLTRGRMRLALAFFGFSSTTSRRPSSIREVSVRRSATALRFARTSSSRGNLTVVRSIICIDISSICLYVKYLAYGKLETEGCTRALCERGLEAVSYTHLRAHETGRNL